MDAVFEPPLFEEIDVRLAQIFVGKFSMPVADYKKPDLSMSDFKLYTERTHE